MSNDLTPTPARKRLDLPAIPVHQTNADGSVIPFKDAQWKALNLGVERSVVLGTAAIDAMFAIADAIAIERALCGEDDRRFGALMKAKSVKVERNQLTAMANWWRKRFDVLDKRTEAINYAHEHGITKMLTLERHFSRKEVSERRIVDAETRVVAGSTAPADPARSEPLPDWSFADATLALYGPSVLPEGIRTADLKNALQRFNGRRWRREVSALVAWVAANPKVLLDAANEVEVGEDTLRALAKKLGAK